MRPRLLIAYKPVTLQNPDLEDRLLSLLGSESELIARREFIDAPEERVKELYKEHETRPFYKTLCDLLLSSKLVVNVFTSKTDVNSDEWIRYLRESVIGATDPEKATPGSYRYYVHQATGETMQKANSEQRSCDNGVHCSDSIESGLRESAIFFWDWILSQSKVKNPEIVLEDFSLGKDLARAGQGIFLEERLEDALRKRNLVMDAENFINYEELPLSDKEGKVSYGWKQRGSETYTAAGKVKVNNGSPKEREFVAKSCVKMGCQPDAHVNQWLYRRQVLEEHGVQVPTLYFREPGTYYEQYLAWSASEILNRFTGEQRLLAIKQIAKIVDTKFTCPISFMDDLRSDGKTIFFTDFGEDLGGVGRGSYMVGKNSLLKYFKGEELTLALKEYGRV